MNRKSILAMRTCIKLSVTIGLLLLICTACKNNNSINSNVLILTFNSEPEEVWFGELQHSVSKVKGEYRAEVTLMPGVTPVAFYPNQDELSYGLGGSFLSDELIGWNAFLGCESLTSVVIPYSVTGILEGAFSGCTSLESVTIPNSVTDIANAAFAACESLKSIIIPDSVTRIGDYAFVGCESLKSATIPESAVLGKSVFPPTTEVKYSHGGKKPQQDNKDNDESNNSSFSSKRNSSVEPLGVNKSDIYGLWRRRSKSGNSELIEDVSFYRDGEGKIHTTYKEYTGGYTTLERMGDAIYFKWELDGNQIIVIYDGERTPEFTYKDGKIIDSGGNVFSK